jgi:serine/threonine-protein kinase
LAKEHKKRDSVQLAAGMEVAGGYQLTEKLGVGGFAQVWQADTKDGRRLALKFIPCDRDLSAAKEIRAIQAIRELAHPNLIAIEQVISDVGCIVVAMELADGSLLDLLGKYQEATGNPIAPDVLCFYLAQAAQAIDFLNAHKHHFQGQRVGFQHCDIKPSNLLLFDDVIKVSDFGLATATGATIRIHRKAGTLQFAAPEVFQGRLSDWTDQYSLAVTYIHLRTGGLPFKDTPTSFRHSYVRSAPDLSMLPEAEHPIILRALAATPQDRWPSCEELVNRLAAVTA